MRFFKNILLSSLLLLASFFCFAQKDSCEFILVDTITNGNAEYYMASNVNGWNPKDDNFKFKKDKDGTNYLMYYFDKGTQLEFKFTKGSWGQVEGTATHGDVENRKLNTDTAIFTIQYIHGWKNSAKIHTASVNVKIIDTAFYIPQLKRSRRIWIYLPKEYSSARKRYPVMYMQDGQNLFDELTAGYGEWGVDEFLDSLQKDKQQCIIVGIDNGGDKRMSEYNPYEFTYKDTKFNAEGDEYVNFLMQTLKPFIDIHYRTLPAKENTIVAGSSMGGLIAYYAILKYPEKIGKAGVFSPAFWTAPPIEKLTDSLGNKVNGKLFFYMGELEDSADVMLMKKIEEKIATNSSALIYSLIGSQGKHNEAAWRKWFPQFYNFIMADGFNNIIKEDEE